MLKLARGIVGNAIEARTQRRQELRPRLREHDARRLLIEHRVELAQHLKHLGNVGGELDAGEAAAGENDGQPGRPLGAGR